MRPRQSSVRPAVPDYRQCKIEEYSTTPPRRVRLLRRLVLLWLCVLVPDESEREVNISLMYSLAGEAKGIHLGQCKKIILAMFHPPSLRKDIGEKSRAAPTTPTPIPLTP